MRATVCIQTVAFACNRCSKSRARSEGVPRPNHGRIKAVRNELGAKRDPGWGALHRPGAADAAWFVAHALHTGPG